MKRLKDIDCFVEHCSPRNDTCCSPSLRAKRGNLLLVFIFSFFHFFICEAQSISFDVAAPRAVEAGELFRIEFIVSGSLNAEFSPPVIDGFEVMAGPSESRGTSVQIINGASSRTETTTYTYVLQGFEQGVYTISGAQVTVDGQTYSAREVAIEVVGSADAAAQRSEQGSQSPTTISDSDIFVRAAVNKGSVWKGEPVVVTLRLYSRVQVGGIDYFSPPAFNGFWQQDISPAQVVEERETIDGRVYNSYVLKQYLLYPQQAGALSVEPFEVTAVVWVQSAQSSPRNIFDELMGGNSGYQQVQRKLSSRAVGVTVRELPTGAPEDFDGAVGDFEISSTPPPSVVGANSSASYVLRLEGTGNFPLVRVPRIEFPASFEQYNVTTADNTTHTAAGTRGYREFTYPFIPRTDGAYVIPGPGFSYFDPSSGRYVTLSGREIAVEVTADTTAISVPVGVVGGISREDLRIFGQDIQFIKRGGAGLRPKGRVFMWSWGYVLVLSTLVALFFAGYVFGGRYVRNMQNDRFVRNKRANRVALRRLRIAEGAMRRGDRHLFYDEMLKGLWGYMGDKLDIPLSELSKDRVREELFERGVPAVDADDFADVVSECERAQYSPSGGAQMGDLYKRGVELISRLEL